jgi:hypothetical protein
VYENLITAQISNTDNMKLVGEQTEANIANDRTEIATMKDMTREGEITETEMVKQETIHDQPSRLFSNWFFLEDITLVSSSSFAVTEKDYWLTIWNKLAPKFEQTWKYFKCDVELMFMVKSSGLEYGWFGVGWNPSSLTNSPYSMLNARLHEIDITTGGTHMITIPFSSAYEAYDVNEGASNFVPNRPKIYVTQGLMGTLAASFSATVEVRGRFVNWSTFGVAPINNNVTAHELFRGKAVGELQMQDTSTIATASGVVGAGLATAYQTFKNVNAATKQAHEFVGEGRKVGESASEAWEFMSNLWDSNAKQNYRDVNVKPETERDSLEHKARDSSTHNAPTFYGSMSQIGSYIPENENLSFSMHHLPPRHLFDANPKNLREIAQIPCLISQTDCVAGTTFLIACRPFHYNTQTGFSNGIVDYFAQIADLFRWWRGSIDYEFTFHTSSLITGQFVFECCQLGSMDPGTTLAGWSQNFTYLKTVNISGHSTVKIRVPFIFNAQWCPMRPIYGPSTGVQLPLQPSIMRVTCKTLTSGLAGSGAIPHVYVTMKRSAGPDIQFRNLNGGYLATRPPTLEDEDIGELQMLEVQRKEGDFENICMGGVPQRYRYTPEDDLDVITLSTRWSTIESDTSGSQNLLSNSNNSLKATAPVDIFFRIQNWFRYVRGSFQCRTRIPESQLSQYVLMTMQGDERYVAIASNPYNVYTPSAGAAFCVPALNPIIQFEAPFEGDTEWLVTHDAAFVTGDDDPNFSLDYIVRQPNNYDWGDVFMYVRAGRGYDLAFLQPPCNSYNRLLRTWVSLA